jgi:concanavalin A-like lectin/glucanase superfamily protein/putative Ig domain-containing protein/PKD domain-containing protein
MKFFSTLTVTATCRHISSNIRFWIVLFFFTLIASITRGQTNTGFSGFTQSFNPAGSNILFTTTNVQGFFHVGDPIGLATIDGSPLNVFAWYGNLLYSGPATTLYLPAGHYFVEAPGDRNEFAVLPADWSTLTNVGWDSGFWATPSLLTAASFLKFGWVRGAFEWAVIQAGGSNSWDWTTTDQIINAHHGLRKIEMTLQDAPAWVQNPVTLAWNLSPSQFTQAFAQFAQAVAQRYSNLVDVVEVWNEPNIYTLPGTNVVGLYVNMLAAARAALPTVKLSAPVLNSGLLIRDAQALASAGAGSYLDYDAYHDYEARSGAPDVAEATNAVWLTVPQRVQGNFAIFGKPILVDEVGLYGVSALGAPNPPPLPGLVENSGLSWTTGMIYAIKYAIMYAATNNVTLMPHELLSGTTMLTNNDEVLGFDVNGRGPHPKTSAFLMSEYWVNGATLVDWQSPGTNVFLYAWQRPDNTSIVFAWATDGQSFPLSTNTAFTITDIYGRSIQPSALTAQPVLFYTNSPNATALLNAIVAALPGSVNLPPVMGFLDNQNVLKTQTLQFIVPATDPNNYALTYSANSLPTGATLDPVTGVFSWTPNANQTGAYSITFTVTDTAGLTASTSTTILVLNSATDGLVDWWKFDETSGTTASDSAGTDPGSLLGFNFNATSGWTTGEIGGALAFDGMNDYVNLDSSQLSLTNNFSISAWINPRNASGDGVFFCVRSMYQQSGFKFWVDSNDLIVEGQTTAGWNQVYFGVGQIQNNNWYHVVVVYDKSTVFVYLNGVNLAPAYEGSPNWGGDFVMNPSEPTRIGAENGTGPVGFFFDGVIDDVRVYDRTLIPAEVEALYQAADQPPVLAPISVQSVVAGQPLTFTLSASDSNSSNLTYSASALPSGATLNAATGLFSWTPNGTQTGVYDVTFTVSDGELTSSQATTITVSPVGTPAVVQITSVPTVTSPVVQIGSLSVLVAGDANVFTVNATDSGSATLYYAWTFGDGQTSTRSTMNTATHAYEGCGPYTASVVVDDGVYSADANLTVSTACLLGRLDLHATLNFARTNADSCTLSGTCDLPADYNFTGNVVTLDIAGAEVAFTLNSKRRGVNGLNTFTVSSYNKRTGLWSFNVTLRDGSWSSLWNSYGLVNATVLRPGAVVALPVILAIDNETFMATANLHYTAAAGRSGTAR